MNTIDIGALASKRHLWPRWRGWVLVILDLITICLILLASLFLTLDGFSYEPKANPRHEPLFLVVFIVLMVTGWASFNSLFSAFSIEMITNFYRGFHAFLCILGFVDLLLHPGASAES